MEKKRGRPKGSKNKAKEEATEAVLGQPGASNLKNPEKKPRGRPPGNPLMAGGVRHYMSKTQHVYTELAKTTISNTDLYNLYGIVVDASSPWMKDGKWRTHIKIIDPSMFT